VLPFLEEARQVVAFDDLEQIGPGEFEGEHGLPKFGLFEDGTACGVIGR